MTTIRTYEDVWMSQFVGSLMALISLIGASSVVAAETVHPAKLSNADLTGKAFDDPNTITT